MAKGNTITSEQRTAAFEALIKLNPRFDVERFISKPKASRIAPELVAMAGQVLAPMANGLVKHLTDPDNAGHAYRLNVGAGNVSALKTPLQRWLELNIPTGSDNLVWRVSDDGTGEAVLIGLAGATKHRKNGGPVTISKAA